MMKLWISNKNVICLGLIPWSHILEKSNSCFYTIYHSVCNSLLGLSLQDKSHQVTQQPFWRMQLKCSSLVSVRLSPEVLEKHVSFLFQLLVAPRHPWLWHYSSFPLQMAFLNRVSLCVVSVLSSVLLHFDSPFLFPFCPPFCLVLLYERQREIQTLCSLVKCPWWLGAGPGWIWEPGSQPRSLWVVRASLLELSQLPAKVSINSKDSNPDAPV